MQQTVWSEPSSGRRKDRHRNPPDDAPYRKRYLHVCEIETVYLNHILIAVSLRKKAVNRLFCFFQTCIYKCWINMLDSHAFVTISMYRRSIYICTTVLRVCEKLMVTQQLTKIPQFLWNLKVHTILKRDHQWPLSWAKWIKSTPFHPVSSKPLLILYSQLFLGLVIILSLLVSQLKLYTFFFPRHATYPAHHFLPPKNI
jgi:hypothetical protein